MSFPPKGANHKAMTIKQAKKEHQKNKGARLLSTQEQRYVARDVVLEERKNFHRGKEARAKEARKKKAEKEAKEAAKRKQLGVGIATQKAGYNLTQHRAKNWLEGFVGWRKGGETTKTATGINTEAENGETTDEDFDDEANAELEDAPDIGLPTHSVAARRLTDAEIPETLDDDFLSQFDGPDYNSPSAFKALAQLFPNQTLQAVPQISDTTYSSQGAPQSNAIKTSSTNAAEEQPQQLEVEYDDWFDSNTQLMRDLTIPSPPGKRKRETFGTPVQSSKRKRTFEKKASFDYGSDISDWEGFEDSVVDEVNTSMAQNNVIVRDFALKAVDTRKQAKTPQVSFRLPTLAPVEDAKACSNRTRANVWMDGLCTQFVADALEDVSDCSDLDLDNSAGLAVQQQPTLTKHVTSKDRQTTPQPQSPTSRPTNNGWQSTQMMLQEIASEDVELSPVAARSQEIC